MRAWEAWGLRALACACAVRAVLIYADIRVLGYLRSVLIFAKV